MKLMMARKNTKHIIIEILNELQVPKKLKGYDSISEVIVILEKHPEFTGIIYKTAFEQVGGKENKKGTCIERRIRYALQVTWTNSSSPKLYEWYGDIINEIKGCPTAAIFLKRTLNIVEEKLHHIERDE